MKKILILLFLIPALCFGQMVRTKELYKEFTWSAGTQYYKYVPKNLKPVGVILFMHGIGERGTDITLVETNPLPKFLSVDGIRTGIEIPFIVLAPQETLSGQWDGRAVEVVKLAKTFGLPIHHTGLSLGAMKVPEVINALGTNPFASVALVCGKANEFANTVEELKKIPTIFYYDPADKTIDNGYGTVKTMYTKLKAAGADATMIEYTGIGHGIWNKAYDPLADNGYIKWLMAHFAPVVPPVVDPVKDPIVEQYLLNGVLTFKSASGVITTVNK